MSPWSHEHSFNSACQPFNDFSRYPTPPFNEHRMTDPRGLNTLFNRPPANRLPLPPVQPRPFPYPPPLRTAEGCLPHLPPFLPYVTPPPPDRYHSPNSIRPFCGMPAPFSTPPPQNGHHSVVQDFPHVQGFAPNRPPVNCPVPNRPSSNWPPPIPPPPNYPYPGARFNVFDCRGVPSVPMNTFRQRPPISMPFGDQWKGLQNKRHLSIGYNCGKVHLMIFSLLHLK